MKRVVLIDSHAIIHRAYHALPPLTSPKGEVVNAVYGFAAILLRMIRELKPDYIAAAFDTAAPTFRHAAYERYKAQRAGTPDDLASQFAKVRELLGAFGIPIFEKEGFEADDIIGTLVKKLEKEKGIEMIIVTGDLDMLQLVSKKVKVSRMKTGISESVLYDEAMVKERYGIAPSQFVDFKGLRGDPSDNIAGVKGIGEKGALDLIKNFGSIEGVYAALKKKSARISPSIQAKLLAGEEDAKISKDLSTIQTNAPISFLLNDIQWRGREKKEAVRLLFQKFGFSSLVRRLDGEEIPKKTRKKPESASLFDIPASHVMNESMLRDRLKKLPEKIGIIATAKNPVLLFPDGAAAEIDENTLRKKEARVFFQKKIPKYVFDAKSLIHFFRKYNISLEEIVCDVLLAACVTGMARDISYEAIAARELSGCGGYDRFFDVVAALERRMDEIRATRIVEEIELPLMPILADMEERGILINAAFLKKLGKIIDKKLEKLTKEIYTDAGEKFNINSARQLSSILFEKLGLKTDRLKKTAKGGVVSTRESELVKLKGAHPMIEKVLSFRELMKLKTTYIDSLPHLVARDGRLHTTFHQAGTATGRLSSSDPNLQNIPIMSEYGREIRKAFVADEGFLLASLDYSQIELRVAAHIANDEKMIAAFRAGRDIHSLTASEVYNVPLDKVTSDLRRAAKTLNFGVLYGMGPRAFAESTGMPYADAQKFIREYFRDFSGIKKYIEDTKTFAIENGYVETLYGRRRYIPEIVSSNWQSRREAERMAVNHPIQGTATGDIIKIAMIRVDEWIKKEKLEDDVRLLLQVHDELVFEIKESLVKKITPRLKEIMEHVAELKVPLVVDVKIGKNWGE